MNNLYYKHFHDKYIDKNCKLLIVTNTEVEQEYCNIMNEFLDIKRLKTCGFDLEFNQPKKQTKVRRIALLQMALYFDDQVIIIFVDPTLLSKNSNKLLKQLLIDQNIIKIGHGTDSLDIPALYEYLHDDESIISFTKTLFDTRFLCEYLNSLTDNRLCNIYHCIELYKVIDKKQINFLEANEKKLGKFWLSHIDIRKLSKPLIEYAMYDALYLKNLLIKLKTTIKTQSLSYSLIVDVTRLVLLLRQEIFTIRPVSSFHLYMYRKQPLKLLFNIIYEKFYNHSSIEVKKILNFGFFRKQLLPILQTAYYMSMVKKHDIYMTKKHTITNKEISYLNKVWSDIINISNHFSFINKLIDDLLKH